MKVAIGSDHRGVLIKQHILNLLKRRGVAVEDLGTNTEESVDYPDIAASVARAVAQGETPTAAFSFAAPGWECRSPPTRFRESARRPSTTK